MGETETEEREKARERERSILDLAARSLQTVRRVLAQTAQEGLFVGGRSLLLLLLMLLLLNGDATAAATAVQVF